MTKIQKQILSKTLWSVIAFVAVIGFSACGNPPPTGKTVSGTVTANDAGEVLFKYSRLNTNLPATCSFTTNLPAPNDKFVITLNASASSGNDKMIDGLTAGQKVTWTANIESGTPLDHGSGNFVHIINN